MNESVLRENVKRAIDIYCVNELNYFQNNLIIREINDLAIKIGFVTKCFLDKATDNRKVFLKFRIEYQADNRKEVSDILKKRFFPTGIKQAAFVLVSIDQKERIYFASWDTDRDFVVSLIRFLEELTWMNNL